jgi:hypothetical protein
MIAKTAAPIDEGQSRCSAFFLALSPLLAGDRHSPAPAERPVSVCCGRSSNRCRGPLTADSGGTLISKAVSPTRRGSLPSRPSARHYAHRCIISFALPPP